MVALLVVVKSSDGRLEASLLEREPALKEYFCVSSSDSMKSDHHSINYSIPPPNWCWLSGSFRAAYSWNCAMPNVEHEVAWESLCCIQSMTSHHFPQFLWHKRLSSYPGCICCKRQTGMMNNKRLHRLVHTNGNNTRNHLLPFQIHPNSKGI